jgi:hypothetical protein
MGQPTESGRTNTSENPIGVEDRIAALKGLLVGELMRLDADQEACVMLDTKRLLRQAEEKAAFGDELARLFGHVSRALLRPSTRTPRVSVMLDEVRALSQLVQTRQATVDVLLRRGHGVITSTLAALAPSTRSYGRAGLKSRHYSSTLDTSTVRVSHKV